jgi:dTDP-4-dehydrorhamnose 3,5-epimerase
VRSAGFTGGPAEDESTMQFLPQSIPEVIAIEPRVHEDERGFFMECWQRRRFAEGGIDVDFVQDNHSRSVAHTLRGLHYQIRQPQGKLVRVVRGAVFDVAVDLRRSSPSFGRWVGVELSSDNRRQLWVPAGFAHGFLVLTPRGGVDLQVLRLLPPGARACAAVERSAARHRLAAAGRRCTVAVGPGRGRTAACADAVLPVKTLITGTTGQLGRALLAAAPPDVQVVPADRSVLDITDADAVTAFVAREEPALVINAAAWTAVDLAEQAPTEAFVANRDGPGHLARALRGSDARLIHVSTDYVFDGTASTPRRPRGRAETAQRVRSQQAGRRACGQSHPRCTFTDRPHGMDVRCPRQ